MGFPASHPASWITSAPRSRRMRAGHCVCRGARTNGCRADTVAAKLGIGGYLSWPRLRALAERLLRNDPGAAKFQP
jgi:hypothetical protein